MRKQKAAKEAAAAAQSSAAQTSSMGKRYADLAGKTSASPGPMASTVAAQSSQGGGWATVGAGGKVKVPPTGPSASQSRSSSVGNVKSAPSPATAKAPAKPAQTSLKDAKSLAMEEFKKWLHRELARGLIGVADSEYSRRHNTWLRQYVLT